MQASLKIITLENFHTVQSSPNASETYLDLMRLRASGYGPDYPPQVLPYDAIDYVAIHHLFCIEQNGQLEVVGGFRQTLLSVCDYYGLCLPILQLTRDAGKDGHTHERAITTLLDKHRTQGTELLYSSRFTIRKEWRQEKALTAVIKELVCALTCDDVRTYNIKTTIGGSALRFKTEPLFREWGYQPLQWEGQDLAPLQKSSAAGELILIMTFREMSEYARRCAKKHEVLIQKRQLISNRPPQTLKEVA